SCDCLKNFSLAKPQRRAQSTDNIRRSNFLHDRRDSFRQSFEPEETRQTFDAATDFLIEQLESFFTRPQRRHHVIRFFFRLRSLPDRTPELTDNEPREIA